MTPETTIQTPVEAPPDMLTDYLREIETGARGLQQALLSRDPERILAAVSVQRETLDKLQQFTESTGGPDKPASDERKRFVRDMVRRIRRVLETNEKMAATFLAVIEKALTNLTAGPGNARMYNGYGRLQAVPAPLLVHQLG